jgi:hypothetical protein
METDLPAQLVEEILKEQKLTFSRQDVCGQCLNDQVHNNAISTELHIFILETRIEEQKDT